ncbi:MAG: rRNA (uracil1939-C5)-methyltransferase [Synergistaceae bacterium]|nr:rRNA (uracil1939-C5)-methyltransferase [Synergistaceae bacterium]
MPGQGSPLRQAGFWGILSVNGQGKEGCSTNREDHYTLPPGCAPACGACPDGPFPLRESQARKKARAERALAPWKDRLEDVLSVPAEDRLGYRDRTALAARWDGRKGWLFGMEGVRQGVPYPLRFQRPRPFVSLADCPVHTPRVRGILKALASGLPPDEPQGSFPLAFVALSGAQCTLIFKSKRDPGDGWLSSAGGDAPASLLVRAGLEGLWVHLHPSAGVRLFAKGGWRLALGVPRSRDSRGLLYGPGSFSQLLDGLHDRSLAEAREFLRPGPGKAVLDLYCGTGASMVLWQASGAAVLGVEAGGESVECARLNVPGAEILRGTCAERLPQAEFFLGRFRPEERLVYANPPRTGLEPTVAGALTGRLRPARLAYLSCSPGTLSRDLLFLEEGGYQVRRLLPFDFFPRTAAVEVLALLDGPGRGGEAISG